MLYRYLNRNKTRKYLDVLPKLIETYNATPHRSLNNIAPKDVNGERDKRGRRVGLHVSETEICEC